MRSALVTVVLLLLTGCTVSDQPQAQPTPTGPCAAARVQPPDGSEEQRLQADLDGDGRADEVVSWLQDGTRVVQAWLADGRNAAPEPGPVELLQTADVDGDARAEVFAALAPAAGQLRAGVYALEGCRLVPVSTPAGPLELVYGSGPDRLQAAATVRCRPGGRVEQLSSRAAPAPGVRLLETLAWDLAAGKASAPVRTESRVPAAQDPARAASGRIACG